MLDRRELASNRKRLASVRPLLSASRRPKGLNNNSSSNNSNNKVTKRSGVFMARRVSYEQLGGFRGWL